MFYSLLIVANTNTSKLYTSSTPYGNVFYSFFLVDIRIMGVFEKETCNVKWINVNVFMILFFSIHIFRIFDYITVPLVFKLWFKKNQMLRLFSSSIIQSSMHQIFNHMYCTDSIAPSFMGSLTGISHAAASPANGVSPYFTIELLLSASLPIIHSLEPSK